MSSALATETSPLLHDDGAVKPARQPLSRFQIGIVLLVQFAEHMQITSPFMPELVASLEITHGDADKVSFYMGLDRALTFSTLALTTLFWNRASDHLGRKPILLIGLCGGALSLYATGLTKTLQWLIMSRCLGGAFNGNIGILKSIMGEMASDADQLAELFSYMPLAWAATGMIGPLIGGSLAHPTKQFPDIFGRNDFLKEYPYFLPCAVTATFGIFVCVISAVYLKETLKNPQSFREWLGIPGKKSASPSGETSSEEDNPERQANLSEDIPLSERPIPIRDLLRTRRVLLVALNYATLCLSQASLNLFQPLQLSVPVDQGGMGFAPPLVGKILSIFGFLNGILQFLFFAKIHSYVGPKWFFLLGTACGIPMILTFPLTNYLARQGEVGLGVWTLIGVQTMAKVGINMSYGALFIVIAAAAPNKASLGATNGICQTIGTLMRAYGPALTNIIFAISLKRNIWAGNLVYVFLLLSTLVTLFTASLLPRRLWYQDK